MRRFKQFIAAVMTVALISNSQILPIDAGGVAAENAETVENPLLFTDDFQDETLGTSPDYWLENNTTDNWKVSGDGSSRYYGCDDTGLTTTSWLHVFETNVDYSAKLKVPAEVSADSAVGLVIRMTAEDAYVKVGYDFTQSKWYIKDRKGTDFEEQTIWADQTSDLKKDDWNLVRVYALDKTIQVYCNDILILESTGIGQVTTGRAGVFTEKSAVWIDDVSLSLLSGQGRVEKAVLANYILPYDAYTEGSSLYWYNDDIAIINYKSKLWISTDQGQTFRDATEEEQAQYAFFAQSTRTQYIKLHSGNILKIDNGTGGKAYLSKDDGTTYEQVGALWSRESLEKNWSFYGGMNDMLKEVNVGDLNGDGTDDYRVFYCADVRAYGKTNPDTTKDPIAYHWEEVYYTDDEGKTWQKSEFDTRTISALDHICESKIVSCADGDLRMYCTWNDSSSIRYFESHDKGVTWEGEYAMPEMSCARSSCALMEDPYAQGTVYMAFVYAKQASWASILPRNRLVLMRTTDGKNWEFLMDCWRWEDVTDDQFANINQIVDPSITVTEDYVFVLAGWSEKIDKSVPHNAQRQHILKLNKADLTAYSQWPGTADAKAITTIAVTAPDKVLYQKGETLDLTGGYLTVYYYDGSTDVVSLDASGVEITEPDASINYTTKFAAPDMDKEGLKILRVTYEKFADNFTVLVVDENADAGTVGDVTNYPVELEFGQEEIVDGATIDVANSETSYNISGVLTSKGGNPVLTVNNRYIFSDIKTDSISKDIVWRNISEFSGEDVESEFADVVYINIRDTDVPLEVYGLNNYSDKTQDTFVRMDPDVAEAVTSQNNYNSAASNVWGHNRETSGGRVRFATDSKYIAIQAYIPNVSNWGYTAYRGMENVSFDLYIDTENGSEYYGTFHPESKLTEGGMYESVIEFDTAEERNITIYFPILNPVSDLYIGFSENSQIAANAKAYKNNGKIVWYGSSITQGGSVSRPGNTYAAIVGRRFHMDFLNLGFWGSAAGQEQIAQYIAGLDDMSVFVLDYDHNESDPAMLESKQWKFYQIVREAHPNIPIIMVSRPNHAADNYADMREAIRSNYQKALDSGDMNVYFIDGQSFFESADYNACLMDGVHPSDLGASLMAEGIGVAMEKIFRGENSVKCSNSFAGQKYTFSQNVALEEGSNVFVVKATDATGNETTVTFTINRAAAESIDDRTEILYQENFDSATISSLENDGWVIPTNVNGYVYDIYNQALRAKASDAYYNRADAYGWGDYTFEAKMLLREKTSLGLTYTHTFHGIRFGVNNTGNGYEGLEYAVKLDSDNQSWKFRVYDRVNGKVVLGGQDGTKIEGLDLAFDKEMTLKVRIEGASFTVYLNGKALGSAVMEKPITGTIGTHYRGKEIYALYDDMKVTRRPVPKATEKTLLLETFTGDVALDSGCWADTLVNKATLFMGEAKITGDKIRRYAYYTGKEEETPDKWEDYTYSAQINFKKLPATYSGGYWDGIIFGKESGTNPLEYGLNYNPDTKEWKYRIYDRKNSKYLIGPTTVPEDIKIIEGEPVDLKVTIEGDRVTAYLNGELLRTVKASARVVGTVGLLVSSDAELTYDNLHVISRDYGEGDRTVIAAEDFASMPDGMNPFTEDNGWSVDYNVLTVKDGAVRLSQSAAPMSRYMVDGYISADFKLEKPKSLTDGTYYPAQLTARNTTIYNKDLYEARLRFKAVKSGDSYAISLDAVVYSGALELNREVAKNLAFDTVYNLKLLCIGNRIVFTLSDISGNVLAEKIYPLVEGNGLIDRAGNFGIQSLAGDSIPSYVNNVEVHQFKGFTIADKTDYADVAAIAQNASTLITPTKFYAGETVTINVPGDIKAGTLKYITEGSEQNIFSLPEGTVRGEGSGTTFVFTMPADNVTLTAEANASGTDFSIATLATALPDTEIQNAIRFLNRIYLPVNENGEFIKNVTYGGASYTVADYGAVVLPSNLIPEGSELTLETAKIAKVSMFAETAKLYDKTGKYIDFTVKLTDIKNTERKYSIRTYVTLKAGDGTETTIYGDVLEQSINGLAAAY